MPTMVTIRAAAEQAGLPYSALRRLILEGKFTAYIKIGAKFYLNKEKLESFLNDPMGSNEQPATVAGVRR